MSDTASASSRKYSPLGQLVLARLREFYREPEAVFWVYGFPIVMIALLGIAFRNQPVERVTVDVQAGAWAEPTKAAIDAHSRPGEFEFVTQINDPATCRNRLRTGKTDLVVMAESSSPPESGVAGPIAAGSPARERTYQFELDKTRAESRLARSAVHEALQEAAGRKDAAAEKPDLVMTEPGSRYIDFLVPGLLGMSLMGGGLWGVGFVIVDMRLRKLLKRFLATPMKRSDFLLGVMISRLLFMIPEVLVLLVVAWLCFNVTVHGSLLSVLLLILLGAFTFAGVGLLVASRAKTLETVSGLMNLVMLPMWLLSGIFFSTERFPAAAQPFIKALPLTPLIHALRGVMLEGASLVAILPDLALLLFYTLVTFAIALKIFRWQ
ncbi:MAG TPA: ABC transporter permease [Pirellulales bacterium]|jgi:ABC-type multidrug transport system permease subunit|nr:ABC transporter permease [Pirellulales bacterium]